MDRLSELFTQGGQSPWLDNLRRDYIGSGHLASLRDSGIRGLTSNPTIFQNAIAGTADYDAQFGELAPAGNPVVDDYWTMVLQDIDGACAVFAPLHEATGGGDGFVSVEVDPSLAHDGPGTEAAARDLNERIGRPNVMIKIPATVEGLAAIEQMIAEGVNVNVTLIFSLDRYQQVMDAYIAGLERRGTATAESGDPAASLGGIASVASFFISRVDTEVDRRLDEIGTDAALALRGKAAIAQAKLAYQQFLTTFSGPRWAALAASGAAVQRPLWASTSTKNPAYPDTLYVDQLIGSDTVNTLPEATVAAFADHGTVAETITVGVAEAQATWAALAAVGIDMDDVAATLEQQGMASFQKSFAELLSTLETKAAALRADAAGTAGSP